MLSIIIFLVFGWLQSLEASQNSLEDLTQKARIKAESYKEMILQIETQSKTEIKKKSCQAFASCSGENQVSQKKESSSHSLLLFNDKAPLIFVSSSLPLLSLKTLAIQAKKVQAKLVIRGMVNGSLQETAKLAALIDYPLDIDPKLFQIYGIQNVPVFFIFTQNRWHKVQGNIDLMYALEHVKKEQPIKKEKKL